jgi:hypothetical protein
LEATEVNKTIALLAMAIPAVASGGMATPSRDEIASVERSMYDKLRKFHVEAPADLLGLPRGVYLEGFGAVFTTEVSVLMTPGISPFRPVMSKEDIAKIRAAKEQRMPEVRALMRQMMVDAAASLDRVPINERIVVGLVLFYNKWEDRGRMPRVITMQAEKSALLEVAANRAGMESLERAILVREE